LQTGYARQSRDNYFLEELEPEYVDEEAFVGLAVDIFVVGPGNC
jgi:hypothetical protein